jgi:electron transport complex protein RnfE
MKLTRDEIFTKGVFSENPLILGMAGLCPLLALSMSLREAALISSALLTVLLATNLTVSLLRPVIGTHYRLAIFITIAALYTALTQAAVQALWSGMVLRLGIFLPLLAVNEIILGRAGAFARHQSEGHSLVDAVGMGIGFGVMMLTVGFLRELLGQGTLWGVPVLGEKWHAHLITGLALPFGAFLLVGVGLGLLERTRGHA